MSNGKKTKTAAGNNAKVEYLGQHLRDLDAGRIILPCEWRPAGSARDFAIILWPVTTREYLLVLPPSRWDLLQQSLEELSLPDDEAATVERLISSNTYKRTLDSYGRLPIPEEASKALGIGNEVTLVGRVKKFEVWNSARLASALTKPTAPIIENTLKYLKT